MVTKSEKKRKGEIAPIPHWFFKTVSTQYKLERNLGPFEFKHLKK